MKKITLLVIFLATVFSLGFHGISNGQLLLDENFSYPAGDLITAHGWIAHSGAGTQPITVNATGLTFPGYIDSGIGNAALVDNTGEDDNKTFTTQTSGVVYAAFMVNVTTVAAGYFFHFSTDPAVSTFRGKVFMDATNHFGVSLGSNTGTYASSTFNLGTTYLLVIKYEIVSGTLNDIMSMYIFDTSIPATEPAVPTIGPLTDVAISDINPASVAMRQFSSSQNILIDGIRVGLTWTDLFGGTISAPAIQAQNITFSSISTTGMTASFTIGDGAKRIVIMNTTNSFTNPTDGTDPAANTVYSGSGQQVVYNNSGNTVSVTGLTGSTTYWFRVYEYNGSGASTKYLTTTATLNPNSQSTSAAAVPPSVSLPTSANITNTSALLGGTITADGGTPITERGTVWKNSSGVAITDNKLAEGGTTVAAFSHTRSPLPPKTQIFYKAFASNSTGTSLTTEASFYTLANEPATHVTGFAAAPGGTTTINLTWTAASTGADGYLILQTTGAVAPTGIPVDATGYTVGSVLGDGTVAALVAPGTSLAQIITLLLPATQYSFTIIPFAWDGVNSATYNYFAAPVIPGASATTTGTSSAILYEDFNYTVPAYIGGNGAAGTSSNNWTTHSVTAGQTTTIDILSGNLSYPGLAASNGNKVYLFSNANATSRDVNRAFTSTATALYYSALINVVDASQIPSAAPDYFMHFGATSGASVTVFGARLGIKSVNTAANYRLSILNTSGGTTSFTDFAQDLNFGTTYLVVVKYDRSTVPTTASLWVNPASLGGAEPAGQVTNTSGTSTFATFASICLRNSATTPKAEIDEIRVGPTWADVTPAASIAAPTIQTSNFTFSNVLQTQMNVLWTNGNGSNRVVKINTANSFTAPGDGADPVANTAYAGSGEQVIYNGSGSTVPVVTGLTAATTYWYQAWEYNGTGSGTVYCRLTGTNNPLSQATAVNTNPPSISLPTVTSIGPGSAILGGTITGDGGAAITERGTVWNTTTGVTIADNKMAEGGTSIATFSHTRSPLPAKTHIFFKAFATNSVGTSLTTESSFFTLANEPVSHVIGFAAVSGGTTSINLTWTTAATGADGYLILQKTGAAAPTGIPADATGYTVGSVLGDGTVAALVAPGSLLARTITGLSPATQYSFTIIPFAWDGANNATYNYYVTPPIPSASATTTGTGPVTYTWQGVDNGLWTTATNWNPTRTAPAISDILQFNDGTSKTVTAVPTETIGKLILANNTSINLQSTAAATISISGVSGTDLDIPAGCALNLNAVNAITLAIATTATGSISGNMTFSSTVATAHRLIAVDAGAITFNTGAIFTAGVFFSGNPFGSATSVPVSAANSVIFAGGSTYVHQAGSNPFSLTAPASVVVFQAGSLYKVTSNSTPAFSGRTYANFELDAPTFAISTSGGSPVSIDNLTITNGTLNFNMTGPTSGMHQIHGNILVAAGGILNFSPTAAGTVTLNGTTAQSISGTGPITAGTNSTIEIANSNAVNLNTLVTLNGQLKLTSGLLTLGSSNLVLGTAATITGTPSSSAMVVATGTGQLQKVFATGFTGSFIFPVGDNTTIPEYSPVSLNFISGTFAAGNYAGVNLVNAKYPSDPNTVSYLNRYWNITSSAISAFNCSAIFQYLPADVVGNEAQMFSMRVVPTPFTDFGLVGSSLHQLYIVSLTDFGTFTGSQPAPTVQTLPANLITATTATLNGNVIANWNTTAISFEYGLTSSYSTVVPGFPVSVIGGGSNSTLANITGLTINTTYHFRVNGTNSSGISHGADLTFTTGCPIPSAAGTVTGPANVCLGGTGYIYTVPAIANATTYTWALPAGAIITAGSNTNSITVSYPAGSVSGNVSVTGSSICGSGSVSPNLAVTVNTLPVPTITGPANVCINSTGNVYTTQTGMTGYVWTVSAGGTITAGQTTSSITVSWTTVGTKNVTVSYTSVSGCTPAVPTSYSVTVTPIPVPTISGPGVVCANAANIVYTTEAGMTNYNWAVSIGGTIIAGAGTNAITVSWPYSGNRTVSVNYTSPSGCSALTATVFNVTINPAAVPFIGSSNNPCINSTNNQYITNSGMFSYVWGISSGGTIVSGQGTSTINVTWNGIGAQWVSVSYTNTFGCASVTPTVYNLFVNPLPYAAGAITGTAAVCAGTNGVAYSCADILNATSYTWSLPAGATIASGAGTKSITVNYGAAAVSGDITVSGTNSCGNGPVSPAFPVNVNPLPAAAGTITGPASVCAGTTGVAYSVPAIANAAAYVWTVPAGAIITSGGTTRNIVVTFGPTAGAGVITVKGTNTCGTGVVSANFNVTIHAIPAAPVVSVAGNVLTSSSPTGNQWYFEGTAIAGATGQTYTVINNTGYYWCVVTVNGCSSTISNKVWVVITGQQELPCSNFNVYPIPNDGRFTVAITSTVQQTFSIMVYNQLGSKIFELGDMEVYGTFEKQIDLRPVANGIYSVVFLNSEHKVVRKVLVNK